MLYISSRSHKQAQSHGVSIAVHNQLLSLNDSDEDVVEARLGDGPVFDFQLGLACREFSEDLADGVLLLLEFVDHVAVEDDPSSDLHAPLHKLVQPLNSLVGGLDIAFSQVNRKIVSTSIL